MKRKALLVSALWLSASPLLAQPIPERPDQLTFKPLVYNPPSARDHRVVLKNGLVVFIAEDRTLPLVNISLVIRTGRWLEPADKAGLAALTGSQIRRGGSKSLTAEALDETLDALAAQVGSGIGDTTGSASLNCLADNLDESLRVFVEMLRFPRFQEDRLALAREQTLQEMKKRNDDAADIEAREWNRLLYGPDHFTSHLATKASIDAITRADLQAFHDQYYAPSNMIAAVSGAFSRPAMLRKLEAAFAGWPAVAPPPPIPTALHPPEPGLYRVNKEVNQGRFSTGLLTVKRDSPDVYALEVMNEILGGSDFTSRITKRVRSDEGLAYSAGSALSIGVFYPGRFRALFQSKSRSVAHAGSLVLEEIRKMRDTLPAPEEMETIKNNLVQTFPSSFASRAQAMSVFASDEYTKRDPTYWTSYRDRIRAVTPADVQRVARTYLVPEKLVMLVVGDQKEIDLGDPKHPVTLVSLAPGGRVVNLPLPDPMTLQRPAGP
jgi:predicted Zn-dependent peptidase